MTRNTRVFASTILLALASAAAATAQTAYVPDAGAEENVGSATQDLQGRPNAANSTACVSCSTTGATTHVPALAIVGSVVAFGAVVSRRTRRG
jgi:hypothetical protein